MDAHCYRSAVYAILIEHNNTGVALIIANLIVEPHLDPLERVIDFAQQV